MPYDYFGEDVAATYDDEEVFAAEVVDPAVDLLAELRERFGGWKREPFTSESGSHVSVWEKPATP